MILPRHIKSGFTLIEILIVIGILSILSSIVFLKLNSVRDRSNVVKAASDLNQITQALALYLESNGTYPCYDEAWSDAKEKIWSAPYIGAWPKQPTAWGGRTYHWAHNMWLTYSISLDTPGQENALALDKLIDDGNLATGLFIRFGNGRAEWMGMEQSVPLVVVNCP